MVLIGDKCDMMDQRVIDYDTAKVRNHMSLVVIIFTDYLNIFNSLSYYNSTD